MVRPSPAVSLGACSLTHQPAHSRMHAREPGGPSGPRRWTGCITSRGRGTVVVLIAMTIMIAATVAIVVIIIVIVIIVIAVVVIISTPPGSGRWRHDDRSL
eukprot:GHVU01212943.1.p5 GENE.GHVU01212943.1~~GHVU01212943.1.p5  ORF type:complete len:101 (-),score=13.07 GHVU01212943.1:990-1292(-)